MEHEATTREDLSIAQAVHNNGGVVVYQFKQKHSINLNPHLAKIPGFLIDYYVQDLNQKQTYEIFYDKFRSGEKKLKNPKLSRIPLDIRKVIARRAALELKKNNVVNLGVGVSVGISNIAYEEEIYKDITLTVEAGVIGGIPGSGLNFGSAINPKSIIDQPYQFDFYDGGGLDVAFLSFAELIRMEMLMFHDLEIEMWSRRIYQYSSEAKSCIFRNINRRWTKHKYSKGKSKNQ